MVHKRRKEDAKENCLVYGVAADGLYYQFWRIENSSIASYIVAFFRSILTNQQVLHGPMWNWESEIDRRLIYSTFRSIIRTTLVCSPTTSPVKPEKQKQINAQLAKSYPDLDFGVVESWQEWIVEVDDEDDLVH